VGKNPNLVRKIIGKFFLGGGGGGVKGMELC